MVAIRNYERQDFSDLLAELNTEKSCQRKADFELLHDSDEIEYAMQKVYEFMTSGYGVDQDYCKYIKIVLEMFKHLKNETDEKVKLRERLNCFDERNQGRIITWLIELEEAVRFERKEDIQYISNRIINQTKYVVYMQNYINGGSNTDNAEILQEKIRANLQDISITEIKNQSPRLHQIASDEKIKFVIDRKTGIIHDKSCVEVRRIDDENIIPEANYVKIPTCEKCRRKAYIRAGAKDFKELEKYEKLFSHMRLTDAMIERMYIGLGFQTCMSHMNIQGYEMSHLKDNAITIWYKDDRWRLGVTDKGRVRLEHNNYKKLKKHKRQFTPGFHIQSERTVSTSFGTAMSVIKHYEYMDHFTSFDNKVISSDNESAIIGTMGVENSVDDITSNEAVYSKEQKLDTACKVKKERIRTRFGNPIRKYIVAIQEKIFDKLLQSKVNNSNTAIVAEFYDSVPRERTLCLYQWKDDTGCIKWSAGMYLKKGVFSANYGGDSCKVPFEKVIRWTYMENIEIEENLEYHLLRIE